MILGCYFTFMAFMRLVHILLFISVAMQLSAILMFGEIALYFGFFFSLLNSLIQDLLSEKVTPNVYVFNSLMNVNACDLNYTLKVYKDMQVSLSLLGSVVFLEFNPLSECMIIVCFTDDHIFQNHVCYFLFLYLSIFNTIEENFAYFPSSFLV